MSTDDSRIQRLEPATLPDAGVPSSTSGLILPTGSPLVQFEVQRTKQSQRTRIVVWVNRNPHPKTDFNCSCDGPIFEVDMGIGYAKGRAGIKPNGEKFPNAKRNVFVCLCQGGFVE